MNTILAEPPMGVNEWNGKDTRASQPGIPVVLPGVELIGAVKQRSRLYSVGFAFKPR